ncbi:c-type cytochrome [Arcobacter cloacae]|uniref:Cytochrome C n=1 Tax=Arcobacter cloacae TaxID=1054034 RepID=A0A6M8NPU8_9BACT|nr:c-type cytochrome [Arcobacter cloacae]QKF90632.1 cytochrome c [Arcobacter cloacae]RXI41415.1 cytochrome C [Arcobacter cloacae]
MNKILLSSAVTVLLLAGCSEDKKTTTQATAEVAKQEIVETKETVSSEVKETATAVEEKVKEVSDSVSGTTQVTEKVAEEIKENSKDTIESTKEVVEQKVEEVKNDVKDEVSSVTQAVTEKVEETTDAAKEVISEATSEEVTEIVVEGPNGEALYKTCASCHGQKGEKEALGKSQVIAGWDKERTIKAMNGYKDGSYGGVMKNIMKPQVENKTDAEIEALATFISNL